MKEFNIKFRQVFLPYLIIALSTILGYTSLIWLLDIKLGILSLNKMMLEFGIPIGISAILIIWLMRKRVRILNLDSKRGDWYAFYQFIMVAFIVLPIWMTNTYLQTSSFEMNQLESISEIKGKEKERYFTINNFEVNRDASSTYAIHRYSGKYNNSLSYYLYFACPFECDIPNIWYGVEYWYKANAHASEAEKERVWDEFIDEKLKEFETYRFNDLRYLEREVPSEDYDSYMLAIENNYPHLKDQEHIILVPKKDEFAERSGDSFNWIFIWLGLGTIIVMLMCTLPEIKQDVLERILNDKPLKEDELMDMLGFLNPFGELRMTAILIDLNILILLIMVISGISLMSPTAIELLDVGGNRRAEVMSGDYWRLFTSMFLHGGIMHLIMNAVGLVICGTFLELFMKPWRFLVAYLIAGVVGSLASIYWNESVVSIGASGAIFGLYGVLLSFLLFKVYSEGMRQMLWIVLGLYAGVSLFFGFIVSGIDNAAHIGGLITGFLIGAFFSQQVKQELQEEIID